MNAASHSKGVINEVLEVRLSHFSGSHYASLLGTSPNFLHFSCSGSIDALSETNLQLEANYIFIIVFYYKSNI